MPKYIVTLTFITVTTEQWRKRRISMIAQNTKFNKLTILIFTIRLQTVSAGSGN